MPRSPRAPRRPDAFRARRRRYLRALGGAYALLAAAPERELEPGIPARFRQDPEFYYLTGWERPGALALFRPGAEPAYLLALPPDTDPLDPSPSPRAAERGGAELVLPLDDFLDALPELLLGGRALHYRLGVDPERDALLLAALEAARALAERGGERAPASVLPPERLLGRMRMRKDAEERAWLRRSAELASRAVARGIAAARPGLPARVVEAAVEASYRAAGAWGPAFPTLVGADPRAPHDRRNAGRLGSGSLAVLDAGCRVEGYASDVARTFPVSGRFSPPQRALYGAVLAAREAGLAALRPGNRLEDAATAVRLELARGLVELGLEPGPVERVVEERLRLYAPNEPLHWLGLEVHDSCPYWLGGRSPLLRPGMVLALEPGLSVPEDGPRELAGLTVRVEDDACVAPRGPELWSSACPVEPGALEELVGSEPFEP